MMLILSKWKRNTLEGATSIITMLQADRLICKESRVVLPSAESKICVILTKKNQVAIPLKRLQHILDVNK